MERLDLNGIESIIFDLGMVIIDLDKEATPKAFQKLAGNQYQKIMKELNQAQFFEAYETGKLSTREFLEELNSKMGEHSSLSKVQNAWNAMLGKIPPRRFKILEETKSKYRTFCLSNTNELHIQFIYEQLKRENKIPNLDPYFEKVYLSHEMGQRKPDVEIFETVIQEQNLEPTRTLFIDDTAGHLVGARKAGLQTFHLDDGIVLEELF